MNLANPLNAFWFKFLFNQNQKIHLFMTSVSLRYLIENRIRWHKDFDGFVKELFYFSC